MTLSKRTLTGIISCLLFIACGTEGDLNPKNQNQNIQKTNHSVEWGQKDKPSIFDNNFKYKFSDLPTEGEAANIPWAGNYWPTYRDNINYRWAGKTTMSPAEKFGKAFGIADLEDKISLNYGIDSRTTKNPDMTAERAAKACKETKDCDSEKGEVCSKRNDEESGHCIETWFGICHAWAPAAIMEKEPKKAVTYNGVEFKVNDIKALVSLTYNKGLKNKFISLRCNKSNSDKKITFDEFGRPVSADKECADTNAGSFHVVISNLLGIQKKSFVEDRTFDYEVWNQPVRSFKVKHNQEVTAEKANTLIGAKKQTNFQPVTQNHSGSLKKGEWKHFAALDLPKGATIKASMTGTGDADLYVKFDEEPKLDKYDCRPWINGSTETCDLIPAKGAKKAYVSIQGYSSASFNLKIEVKGLDYTKYLFNDKAVKFRYVKTTLKYITESDQSTDGNLASTIDRYTRYDNYEYILELDKDGKIIGGEWVGFSKTNHPDFLWLPYQKDDLTLDAGIKCSDVRKLLELSTKEDNGNSNEPKYEDVNFNESAEAKYKNWKHYGPYEVQAGHNIDVELKIQDGDGDLYVKKGSQVTSTGRSAADCVPYKGGKTTEKCSLTGPGKFYVSVRGYNRKTTKYSINIKYKKLIRGNPNAGPAPATPRVVSLEKKGTVKKNVWKHYGPFKVDGGAFKAYLDQNHDADLYVHVGEKPTSSKYTCRPYKYGSNNEECKLSSLAAGTKVYVGINGWDSSTDYTLKIDYKTLD